jgi:hypothetical protein
MAERSGRMGTVNASRVDWGGRREKPTPAETAFAAALDELLPHLDYWLHEDDDRTPWLLVSYDFIEDNHVHDTLRLDFDAAGIKGGWSPAFLNWDDGVRCALARISTAPPDGIDITSPPVSPADLPQLAAAWFGHHQATWHSSPRCARWHGRRDK